MKTRRTRAQKQKAQQRLRAQVGSMAAKVTEGAIDSPPTTVVKNSVRSSATDQMVIDSQTLLGYPLTDIMADLRKTGLVALIILALLAFWASLGAPPWWWSGLLTNLPK